MKFLFLKRALRWPRATGHDVHTFEMARALAGLGHAVGFATVTPPSAEAIDDLPLELGLHPLARAEFGVRSAESVVREFTYLQRRFLRYWGIDSGWIEATRRLAEELAPDVVVAAGLELLLCLAAVRGPARVWYAADDYVRHHLSQVQVATPQTWRHLADAAVAALYERCFAGRYDRAWVVSPEEAWAVRFYGGARAADVVPNGVDGGHFRPGDEPQQRHSCVFWGRLDAEPNVRAVEWFCRRVWPRLRRRYPDARFGVYGFAPTPRVLELVGEGVTVIGDAPDLRPELRRHEVAVMPFVSGGGIKNKVLEAAALGLPIVASPQGCVGLDARGGLPLVVARRPGQWADAVAALWDEAGRRSELGAKARAWVLQRHTWAAAARAALAGLGERAPRLVASPGG